MPATTPQKAEPMPSSSTPLSVTRKVITATSRCRSGPSPATRLLAMVDSSASPATACTSCIGKAASSPATITPPMPITIISTPQTAAAM